MFIPPFCPRKTCPNFHFPPQEPTWFCHRGSYQTQSFGEIPILQCKTCHRCFSYKTFHLEYWVHARPSLSRILHGTVSGSGLRQMARELGVTDKVVANRQTRLSRQALATQTQANSLLTSQEAWVFDGFESFVHSQYFPNNIHLLVGEASQFLWALNYCRLRRKGRMTQSQLSRRENLERSWRAPPRELRRRVVELLDEAKRQGVGAQQGIVRLLSDEKREYAQVWRSPGIFRAWSEAGNFEHVQVSSKLARTRRNPLFAVNYLDREFRKDLAEHTRETTRFGQRVQRCLERLTIKQFHHNFVKPYRVKEARVSEPPQTHAAQAGLPSSYVEKLVKEFWRERAFGEKQVLQEWEARIWERKEPTPFFGDGWCPKFLTRT